MCDEVSTYMMWGVGILFIILMCRWNWEDNKAMKEREEWRELCRLRDRYKPGVNEEIQERQRLVELEERWKGGKRV